MNPYQSLPPRAFWKAAVASRAARDIAELWDPKRNYLPGEPIATFGSCFAQHFSRALTAQGYSWLDAEPAPGHLAAEAAREHGYGIFTARTGNIYTAAGLRQWLEWAVGAAQAPGETWEKDGRHFDPFRPAIEPQGFASREALLESRDATLAALRRAIRDAEHFVMTLGLTEAWLNRQAGYAYAMCPGTVAGEFDEARHVFRNCGHAEVLADMRAALSILRRENPRLNVLLTVSPVPLTASASGKHVLTATTYSKSVLRAVAGELADAEPWVDYFPSYEIITGAPFRAGFYADNLRSIRPEGVEFVMRSFFSCLQAKFGAVAPAAPDEERADDGEAAEDVVCEEEILSAFAPRPGAAAPATRPDARKVCIIGNSHIGAWGRAVREGLFADPGLDLVFWGFPRVAFNRVRVIDRVLVPPDKRIASIVSGGRYETIPADEFDVLVFVGGNFRTQTQLLWMKRTGAATARGRQRALRGRLESSPVLRLAGWLLPEFRGTVLFAPTPLPTAGVDGGHDDAIDDADLAAFNELMTKLLAARGIVYVPQPAETIRSGKWTKAEYAANEGGARHMNARYGALMLAAMRQRILERSPAAGRVDA